MGLLIIGPKEAKFKAAA